MAQLNAAASPEVVVEAISRGMRGEFGDVYKIDNITLLTWVTKHKAAQVEEEQLAIQMGFGRYNNNLNQ